MTGLFTRRMAHGAAAFALIAIAALCLAGVASGQEGISTAEATSAVSERCSSVLCMVAIN